MQNSLFDYDPENFGAKNSATPKNSENLRATFAPNSSAKNNTPGTAPKFSPTEFVAAVNSSLEYAFSSVLVEGEVASYKVSQGKWVFFDLKDAESSVSCFMSLWNLKMPIEDGMKVIVRAVPKVTKWGRFSLTISAIRPVGEGSLKKSFEILKKKLTAEGLFNPAKKRKIPENLTELGVISSTGAAGYADFIKILNARWGGIHVTVAHTQVQGLDAPTQIVRALQYFNEQGKVQMIAILRGGGSADDLAAFNDEELTRAVAASKIPVISGIGHEVDTSLVDLAADVRASTPSNAAELLTPSRAEEIQKVRRNLFRAEQLVRQKIDAEISNNRGKIVKIAQGLEAKYIAPMQNHVRDNLRRAYEKMTTEVMKIESDLKQKLRLIEVLNPEKVLSQGYAIISGKISPGSVVKITTHENEITAEIKEVNKRKD